MGPPRAYPESEVTDMTDQQQKAWDRAANRVLKKERLRLASSSEQGWYYRFTVPDSQEFDGGTVQAWVTDLD